MPMIDLKLVYRFNSGLQEFTHQIELNQLDMLVEEGYHWDTLVFGSFSFINGEDFPKSMKLIREQDEGSGSRWAVSIIGFMWEQRESRYDALTFHINELAVLPEKLAKIDSLDRFREVTVRFTLTNPGSTTLTVEESEQD